jgi:hypothetical protein
MRYEVRLPCRVYSPARVFGNVTGVTLNMSRSGLLLALAEAESPRHLPRVGQAARIVLELPHAASGQRCIECLGRVVRIGKEADSLQLAFKFRRYQFIEGGLASAEAGGPIFS